MLRGIFLYVARPGQGRGLGDCLICNSLGTEMTLRKKVVIPPQLVDRMAATCRQAENMYMAG